MGTIKLDELFDSYEKEENYMVKIGKGEEGGTILPADLKIGTCMRIAGFYNELRGDPWKYSKNPVISIYSLKDEMHFRKLLEKRGKEAKKIINKLDYKWGRLVDENNGSEVKDTLEVRKLYSMALKGVDLLKDVLDKHRFYNVDKKTFEHVLNKVP